jgi:hypothetical protein
MNGAEVHVTGLNTHVTRLRIMQRMYGTRFTHVTRSGIMRTATQGLTRDTHARYRRAHYATRRTRVIRGHYTGLTGAHARNNCGHARGVNTRVRARGIGKSRGQDWSFVVITG